MKPNMDRFSEHRNTFLDPVEYDESLEKEIDKADHDRDEELDRKAMKEAGSE